MSVSWLVRFFPTEFLWYDLMKYVMTCTGTLFKCHHFYRFVTWRHTLSFKKLSMLLLFLSTTWAHEIEHYEGNLLINVSPFLSRFSRKTVRSYDYKINLLVNVLNFFYAGFAFKINHVQS